MKLTFLFLVRLGCWFAATPLLPAMATDAFQAGFATADITPPIGWRRAGGYTELVSTGVHDPLFAKAIVLSQGTTSVAFVGSMAPAQ